MKKIFNTIFFFAFILCSSSVDAQNTFKLKDLIRQQEKLATANGYAVEAEVIMPELSIIRQQYRLERNGEFFGKNNMPYYGESYSLAVKVSGGTLFLSDVVEPWKLDADYARDNASGNYNASLFWTYQRPVNEVNYKSANLEILGKSDFVKPVNAEKNLYLLTDAINDFGLSVDDVVGKKKGVMFWAYTQTDVQDSAMMIDFRQAPLNVEAKADSSLIKMDPASPEKIIGGIYVTPKYERGGRVQYLLSGVAVRNQSNGWSLQLLCVDDKITKSDTVSNITKTRNEEKNCTKKKKKTK